MPLFQTIAIVVAALLFAALVAGVDHHVKAGLRRPAFWLALSAVAGVASAASALISITRHAGTGFTTSRGWPKPFYFRHVSETGAQSSGFEPLYFIGNMLVPAAALLILWTSWRLVRR